MTSQDARVCVLTVSTALLAAYTLARPLDAVVASQPEAQEYAINGFQAWAVAKHNGFTFQPLEYAPGQRVTTPRDGVKTQLLAPVGIGRSGDERIPLAQVASGSASVNRPRTGSRAVSFQFFAGRRLAPGWSVVDAELIGSFTWDQRVIAGSQDMSFRVNAVSTPSSTGSAVIRSVTLRGPPGANWQDAFRNAAAP